MPKRGSPFLDKHEALQILRARWRFHLKPSRFSARRKLSACILQTVVRYDAQLCAQHLALRETGGEGGEGLRRHRLDASIIALQRVHERRRHLALAFAHEAAAVAI